MTDNTIVIGQPVSDNQCRIWPEFAAKEVSDIWNDPKAFEVLESPRAGGSYKIGDRADDWCKHNNDEASLHVKSRLTTWLIDQRRSGTDWPGVTCELIKRMKRTHPLPMQNRADRLLRKLASFPHQPIDITQSADTMPELLAWSESVEVSELTHLISLLQRDGYVHSDGRSISVTEAGYRRIQEMDLDTKHRIGF